MYCTSEVSTELKFEIDEYQFCSESFLSVWSVGPSRFVVGFDYYSR